MGKSSCGFVYWLGSNSHSPLAAEINIHVCLEGAEALLFPKTCADFHNICLFTICNSVTILIV